MLAQFEVGRVHGFGRPHGPPLPRPNRTTARDTAIKTHSSPVPPRRLDSKIPRFASRLSHRRYLVSDPLWDARVSAQVFRLSDQRETMMNTSGGGR